jgi:ankyrin repeat protein
MVRTTVGSAFGRTVILGLALMISAPVLAQNKDLRVLDAVKRRDQRTFTSLLRAKADLNATQPDGATALAWAIHLGQRSMAEALLDAGAKANTVDEYGETPLTLAAANGDGVLVQRLLKAGAKATSTRWNGETALMIAAGAGSVDAVRSLVLHGADVNAADPRRGQTALMWAAAEGHTDVVSALLEIGANANATSKTGFNALVFAVTKDNVESINRLIAAGADPNYTLPSGNKPLLVAMAYRYTGAALALLDRGADMTVRDRAGNTPLHLAAQVGNVEVVKALLAKGADPNVRTPKSVMPAGGRGGGGGGFRGGASGEQTPLLIAARGDQLETMKALIAGGADPLLKAQDGTSLLMAAASGGRLATVKYAYEFDKDINVVTTGSGNTIMHVAVGLGGRTQPEVVEVMQFLADHGAKLDEMNAANRTPISLADGLPVDLAVDLLTKLISESGSKPKIPSKR